MKREKISSRRPCSAQSFLQGGEIGPGLLVPGSSMPGPEEDYVDIADGLQGFDMPAQALEGAMDGDIHILGQVIAHQQDTRPPGG